MPSQYGPEDSVQARDFCFWLQGAVELGGLQAPLTPQQTEVIARHLSLVALSSRSVEALPRADALVQKMRALADLDVPFEGAVWDKLVTALYDVFEHQLDKEVPYNPGHSHGPALMRC